MQVTKRDGSLEDVSFDKVLTRIRKAATGLEVDPVLISQRVVTRIYQGVKTSELDELTSNLSIGLATTNPDYATLASRIAISNHQKNTPSTWLGVVETIIANPKHNLAANYVAFVQRWGAELESTIDYSRDFLLDYFGFKTLELQHYLMRTPNGRVVERPQHLWMRVASSLWLDKVPQDATADHPAFLQIRQTYQLLSTKQYIHATPTNFNSGTTRPQLSSCFLLSMKEDSISGIYDTLKDCAQISKHAGGIGLHIHNVRAKGSRIAGTNGISNGIVPMLRNFNMTARYVDQCWGPGTLIAIKKKVNSNFGFNSYALVPIEQIQSGDEVLTSGGRENVTENGKFFYPPEEDFYPTFAPVSKLVRHDYSGPIYRIKTRYGSPGCYKHTTAFVTGDHPLLSLFNLDVRQHNRVPNFEKDWFEAESALRGHLRYQTHNRLDYHPVRDLVPGDWVAHPKDVYADFVVYNDTPSYSSKGQLVFSQITEVAEHQLYNGPLYDLEVEGETHDYTVAGIGIAHNGGGKRNGSFAIYLEPWHADIEDFLKLKTPQGAEEERARDLFYALWIPDLFMERVEQDAEWTLMCPHQCPGLADCHGEEFRRLYELYESEGRGRKVSAQKLWFKILDSQIETGTPYILYKDASNAKSNQQNLGTIKSSNLCTEIIEYSSPEETAVCNLASLSLPAFIRGGTGQKSFDFAGLRSVVATAVTNLNRVIDINYYPTPETLKSNMRHRPIGLGIQGLADVFAMLRIPWESEKAAILNQRIAEHIYYAAVETSANIARTEGAYETYQGSPASKGQLQPDLWGVQPLTERDGTLDWQALRALVAEHGLRNSLLIAPMPTASTSQILGNTECFEPVLSNIFTRRTLSGEYIIINKHLMTDLRRYGVWSDGLKQKIIAQNGSVQGLDEVPDAVQKLYKTAWEIKQRTLIDMAADRGAFICQSQSLNLFVADPTYAKLTSMHFYSWRKGLKTGIYYLRTRAPVMAQKFTVDPEILAEAQRSEQERLNKAGQAEEGCLVCSA
jgi:ribonucleoside-diphosphate reductase alpha subunit